MANPPSKADLLKQAQEAIRAGAPVAAVSKRISDLTGGKVAGYADLYQQVNGKPLGPVQPQGLLSRAVHGAAGVVKDVASLASGNPGAAAQTAAEIAASPTTGPHAAEIGAMDAGSFGLPGRIGSPEGRQAYRQTVADAYKAHPVAAGVGAAVGGAVPAMVMPEIGLPSTLEEALGARTLGRVGVAAVRGAAGGATLGAAEGAGHAQGGVKSTLEGAGKGAAGGAAGGAVLGAGLGLLSDALGNAAALRAGAKEAKPLRSVAEQDVSKIRESIPTNEELAGTLPRSHSNLPMGPAGDLDLDALMSRQRMQTAFVREHVYGPIQDGVIDDPGINDLLHGKVGTFARQRATMVKAAKAAMGKDYAEQSPTVAELQEIRSDLRDRAQAAFKKGRGTAGRQISEMADRLDAEMQRAVPGLKTADAQYRIAKDQERAFDDGVKAIGSGSKRNRPAQIAAAASKYEGNPAALDNFRRGMEAWLYDYIVKKGGRISEADVQRWQSAGMLGRLKTIFNGDTRAFEAFQDRVKTAGAAYLKVDEVNAAKARLAELDKQARDARKQILLVTGLAVAPAVVRGGYEAWQFGRHIIP